MIILWSPLFWIIVAAWCILTAILVDEGDDGHDSNGIGASITFAILFLAFFFLGDLNIKTFFRSFGFLGILKFIGLYLIIGIVWSFIKWYLFLLKRKEKYAENPWQGIPTAKEYRKDIVVWMSYWPWSMTWTLLNDPIKRFFNFVYLKFSTLYQKLSDRIFKDIIELKKQQEEEKRLKDEQLQKEVEARKQERKKEDEQLQKEVEVRKQGRKKI